MSVQFEIDFDKFKITDNEILFFELVITQNKAPVLKLDPNFTTVNLYDKDEHVPPEMIKFSMIPRCARLDFDQPIEFYLYKVKKVRKYLPNGKKGKAFRLAYIRHIEEDISAVQDVCEARVKNVMEIKNLSFVKKDSFNKEDSKKKFTRKTEMNFNEGIFNMSDNWLMQREFYSKSHFSCSYALQAMDYNILYKFIKKHKHDNLHHVKDLAVAFGNFVFGTIFEYGYDRHFKTGNKGADAGDVQVEITGEGDCEDIAFFYMRMFRLLASCPLDMGNGIFRKRVDELRKNYVVFAYLCDVDIAQKTQFHCTTLMISQSNKFDNISFEGTCPNKSYILKGKNIKLFDRWHKASYVLMDNLWYGSFHHGTINELTPESKLGEIEFKNY